MSGPVTQADALAVLQRNCDAGWLLGHLADPNGKAMIAPWLAIAEAASTALTEQAATCQISEAPGGRPGVCSISLRRTNTISSGQIPQGFRLRTAVGVELVVVQAIDVAVGQADVTLPLETLRRLELVNTIDDAFAYGLVAGALLDNQRFPDAAGVLDNGGQLLFGPNPYVDALGVSYAAGAQTLRYLSSAPITGAAGDWLSVLGDERMQPRQPGETDGAYRARIRNISDAVSPRAISEAVRASASQAGLGSVWLQEFVNGGASAAVTVPLSLGLADWPACDVDFFDDPVGVVLPAKHWRTLELCGMREGRAYFRLALDGPLVAPDGYVLYGDDGFFDDPYWGFPDIGLHPTLQTALFGVCDETSRRKAGGVVYDFFLENAELVPSSGCGVGDATAAIPTTVWTHLADPLAVPGSETRAWLLRDALLSTSAWGSTWGNFSHFVVFTFSDGTTFTTARWGQETSEQLTYERLLAQGFPWKPIVRIDGAVIGDGVATLSLAGTFWMTPYAL